MNIKIIKVDYDDLDQGRDVVALLNDYALDPMGGGTPLKDEVQQNLVAELSKRDFAFSIIAYVDDQPAALANCFEGFSTFKARPLVNIHDMVVKSEFRGLGLSQKIMQKIENIAREIGACKITLEVLSGNKTAQNAYKKFGFRGYELDPEKGQALFWEKTL